MNSISLNKHAKIRDFTLEAWMMKPADRQVFDKPCIIRAGLKSSNFITPDYLLLNYPNLESPVTVDLPENGVPYAFSEGKHRQNLLMVTVVQMLRERRRCYLSQLSVKSMPEIEAKVDLSNFPISKCLALNLWMGFNTRSGLHFDTADNILVQTYGTKYVIIAAPDSARSLYAFTDNPSKSAVDPEAPDIQNFPRFLECELLTATIQAGDVLLIPQGWWHYLRSDDISISLNCWHGSGMSVLQVWRQYFAAAGLSVFFRWAQGFIYYGLLKHKFERRLFCPPPIGVWSYLKARSLLRRR